MLEQDSLSSTGLSAADMLVPISPHSILDCASMYRGKLLDHSSDNQIRKHRGRLQFCASANWWHRVCSLQEGFMQLKHRQADKAMPTQPPQRLHGIADIQHTIGTRATAFSRVESASLQKIVHPGASKSTRQRLYIQQQGLH